MSEGLKVTYLNLGKPESGSIIATLGMHIPILDLYLSKIKLVRKKDGSLYLAPPAEEFVSYKTGNKEFQNFFWFGKNMSERWQVQGFKAIQDYCRSKNIEDPTGGQPYQPRDFANSSG